MRRRFIVALILAIFPFALLTAGQSVWRLFTAYDDAQRALVDAAQSTTAQEANIIGRAKAVLQTLENQPEVSGAAPECSRTLAGALIGLSEYTNIIRLDANGQVVCTGRDIPPNLRDRSKEAWWAQLLTEKRFFVSEQHRGAVSGELVLTAALPRYVDGRFDGAMALGIRGDFLASLMEERRLPKNAVAALLDAKGKIISSTDGEVAQVLFDGVATVGSETLNKGRDAKGSTWLYAMVPVLDNDLFLVFAERESALFVWSYLDVAANILLPLIMALFAFTTIWLSADRFVLRWITYLQRVARAYGRGHFALRPAAAAAEAPEEIQSLAMAMGEMAQNIRQRDASLRQALEQRSLMIREIHHRVKNNLQIIGSLLQLEIGRIEDPTSREALRLTQTRINAIALSHRILEEVDSQTVVNLKTLLGELSALLHGAFSGDRYSEGVQVSAPSILIETDVAVPISLFLVERLSVIFRSGLHDNRSSMNLEIFAERQGEDQLVLVIAHDTVPIIQRTSKGPDFAAAYLRQLRAKTETNELGRRTSLHVQFPLRSPGIGVIG